MEVVPPRKDLASRLADVFGALGPAPQGGATPWSLQASSLPFNAGRPLKDDDIDSDEEHVPAQVMPQSLIDSDEEGPQDSDDEEQEGGRQKAGAAAAACIRSTYRKMFEQEEEEDEYDRFADEGWSGLDIAAHTSRRPDGKTEVPDDNYLDRLSALRRPAGAVGDAAADEPDSQAMDVDQAPEVAAVPAAPTGPSTTVTSSSSSAAAAAAPSGPATQRVSVFSSSRLERSALAPPPTLNPVQTHSHGRSLPASAQLQGASAPGEVAGMECGDAGEEERRRKVARRSSGKRVCFAPDVQGGLDAAADTAPGQQMVGPSGGQQVVHGQQQQQQRSGGWGRGGSRRGGGGGGRQVVLNWQRPGFVPEYVKHPERYTRYDLGESLTVGGGERGVTPMSESDNTGMVVSRAGEAASLRQAVAAAQQVAGPREGQGHEEEQCSAAPLAVGKGAVKFVPKGRAGGEQASSAADPRGSTPAHAAARQVLLACGDDDGEGAGEDVAMGEGEAAVGGRAAGGFKSGPGAKAGGRRKFRTSKAAVEEGEEAGPGDMH